MTKIHDIARHTGVSVATVSRVFNKKPYVKEHVRKQVLASARELGYAPRVTTRKSNILIIVEGLERINLGNYETLLLTTISKHLIRERVSFEIIPIHEVDYLYQNSAEGAVAILYDTESIRKIQHVKSFPLLTINYPVRNCHAVFSDHEQGIVLAMEHLVEQGHRRIGLFVDYFTSWGSKERIRGYHDSIGRYSLPFDKEFLQSREGQSFLEATARIIKAQPTALIIASEDSVMPVTYALHLLNKRIPSDISVVSFENARISQYCVPPHTTICQPLEQMAEISARKILEVIREKTGSRIEVCMKNTLIERQSVRKA